MMLKYLLILVVAAAASDVAVDIRGQFLCKGKPYSHLIVKLVEVNIFFPNKRLRTMRTNADGNFSTSATASSWLFEPNLQIRLRNHCYHGMNMTIGYRHCGVPMSWSIPSEAKSDGHLPKTTFDFGVHDLVTDYSMFRCY
ncbi:unnamed protein product [Caenorhabditis bovis]|uniref:Transthyretin-like family protein n=1 Tax=Caenorhabditis bovis TaxID=2654633 RepID=A0A8S1ED78_9PELO|nr:unnamed protein product [Caenorhabditis bovis]